MPWSFFASTGKEKVVIETTPVGLIVPFGGTVVPSGWLLCQGQEVSINSYPDLAQAISETYGPKTNGSGAAGNSHIVLPNLCGRTPIGSSEGAGDRTDINGQLTGTGVIAGGSSIAKRQLGEWLGSETVTITSSQSGTPAHNHTVTNSGTHGHTVSTSNSSHYHPVGFNIVSIATGTNYYIYRGPSDAGSIYSLMTGGGSISPSIDSSTSGISINTKQAEDASSSHDNVMPSLVLNFIIKH